MFGSASGEGGVVCLTSRSEKLFQMLKPTHPIIKLIINNCQAHLSNYRGSGLYTALLATK